MKVVFCIYNFVQEKLPLQPWLTIYEVARRMVADGYDVHIVTDTHDESVSEFNIHVVNSLRGSNKTQIYSVMDAIAPDVIVTLITPLNLATGNWLERYSSTKTIAFSSYPFYNAVEMLRAIPHVRIAELKSYLRHLLVPEILWKSKLKKNISCVICQSVSGKKRLLTLMDASIPVYSIPPGINLDVWNTPAEKKQTDTLRLLYLGTASAIRGFEICLQAYQAVADNNISLTILARGATANEESDISNKLEKMGIRKNTDIIGGWIDKQDMITHINSADVVVLPFVLVPSELPVSVMEVIACGTPVITTNIDGLPSTVGTAGVIVKQGSVRSLVSAINDLYENREKLSFLNKNCVAETNKMFDWDVMYQKWLDKINGTHKG